MKKENGSLRIKHLRRALVLSSFYLIIQTASATEEGKVAADLAHKLDHGMQLGSKRSSSLLPSINGVVDSTSRIAKDTTIFTEPPVPIPTQAATPVSSFIQSVRDFASEYHKKAVKSPLMNAIFTAAISQQEYAFFQYAILEIYSILEAAKDHEDLPGLSEFLREAKRDISQEVVMEFLDDGYRTTLDSNESLSNYIQRVEGIQGDDVLLLAHIFVLFGGDLAASTILHPKLDQAGIPERLSRRYSFLNEAERLALQNRMRKLIDNVNELYPHRVEEFKTEVLEGYRLNLALFSSLYPLPPKVDE
ncbi:biliverdin-producing heme oxygenase [Sansalvadorimonas verongulae]|uniref:biliverdin-producing heme oxygenase n=1 Tax=Sansalvadorimonas verongulae TaxID=2172824 RepID=UPI0012BC9D02|nr:biliverdin-producing heme oxygenase [Sansalvadorimonas verongulae]MTI15068.1 hypothetical protein [Sansalvadorimonas verongulae]